MNIYINPKKELWQELCTRPSSANAGVQKTVEGIIEKVRTRGDDAIRELAKEIDGITLDNLLVYPGESVQAASEISEELKKAINEAYANIETFHKAQIPQTVTVQTAPGVTCIQKPVAIDSVGLYVPGGTAPLFSTVLMLAIPAKLAGCREIILCSPASRETGRIAPAVLYAAKLCGVTKVFRIGGAQAIAAMAYGTQSVPKVCKIFGPGNQYVTTAKQMLGGRNVAIDMPAGPSEVMVIADESANPAFVAADLLSQAEHGRDSQVMLVCSKESIAKEVEQQVMEQAARLGREEFIEAALSKSRFVVFGSTADMVAFANAYAPEHLIISTKEPWNVAQGITSAGSVFIGNWSPESAGDYASGTNHTLPTCGWAAACSGVNMDSYYKKITFQELSKEGLKGLAGTIVTMAMNEGLDAHANAVKIRLDNE